MRCFISEHPRCIHVTRTVTENLLKDNSSLLEDAENMTAMVGVGDMI